MNTPAERIKETLEKSGNKAYKQGEKSPLTDEQVEQKADDIRAFFDNLTAKVEVDINQYINIIAEGIMPTSEEMDETITSFNHIKTINDVRETYIPRHNIEDNLDIIRLYVASHYPKETLERLDSALINGQSPKSTAVAS